MSDKHKFNLSRFIVPPGGKIALKEYDPGFTGDIKDKELGKATLKEDISALSAAQELLWASKEYSLLIILQAMDAAGKDSTIKHVMTGINPQGCDVFSFKAPTDEERLHHFLWRPQRYLPPRGKIAIFNRSYYEEVLVVRVHPELLDQEWLPPDKRKAPLKELWATRYAEINEFEKRITRNGIKIIKFFLNVSKEEQCRRFLKRLNDPEKLWKFSPADFKEREYWEDYQKAYEEMLTSTSTEEAPWHVIPADNKWYMRAVVADVITSRVGAMNLTYPEVSDERQKELSRIRELLEKQDRPST